MGGNLETGFLVEVEPSRRPDFWMAPEDREPVELPRLQGGRRYSDLRRNPTQSPLSLGPARRMPSGMLKTNLPLRIEARGIDAGTCEFTAADMDYY